MAMSSLWKLKLLILLVIIHTCILQLILWVQAHATQLHKFQNEHALKTESNYAIKFGKEISSSSLAGLQESRTVFIFGACFSGFNQLETALKILGYSNYQHIPLSTDISNLYWNNTGSIFVLLDSESRNWMKSKINNKTEQYERYKKYKYEKIINYFQLIRTAVNSLFILNIYHHEDDLKKWGKLCDILSVSIPNISFPDSINIDEKCNSIDLTDMKLFLNLSDANMSTHESYIFNIGDEIKLFDDIYFVQNLISHGWNGAVYTFENLRDHKKYAVKRSMYAKNCWMLHKEYVILKMFENMEKRKAVPDVYKYEQIDNTCVLQMELIENASTFKEGIYDEGIYDDNGIINDMIQIFMRQIVDCYNDIRNVLSVLHENNIYLTDLHPRNILYKMIKPNKLQCYLIDFGDTFNLSKSMVHSHLWEYRGPAEYYSCYAFYKLMFIQQRKQYNFTELNRYARINDNYNLAALMIDTVIISLKYENISTTMYDIYWRIQHLSWNKEINLANDRWNHLNEMKKIWELRMLVVQSMKQFFFKINFNHGFQRLFLHIENNYQCSKQQN